MLETRVRSTSSISGAVVNGAPAINFTSGSVLFVDGSGNLGQNNAQFFWDNTLNRLDIGGITGVGLSAAAGVLTIGGIGNVNNENLIFNFEGTSNQVGVTSGTGVATITLLSSGHNFTTVGSVSGFYQQNISTGVSAIVKGVNVSNTSTTNSATSGMISVNGTALRSSNTGGNTLTLIGTRGLAQYSGTGTQVDAMGVYGIVQKVTSASGSITDAYSIYGDLPTASGGGTITRAWAGGFNGNVWINNLLGIGTTAPTNDISFGGNAARILWMERHTTANTAGNSLTVQSGGATSAATDKNGGNLILASATATGTGSSNVLVQTVKAGVTGTADRTVATVMTVFGDGGVEHGSGATSPGVSRLALKGGTAIATTDWALGAGWGANATVSAVTGNDSRGTVTVTTSTLDTPLANPTLTLTFKDLTWTTVPFATANLSRLGTGLTGAVELNTTATTLVLEYIGTPTAIASNTYIFYYVVIG